MTGERVLVGSTFAIADDVHPDLVAALRAAGAVGTGDAGADIHVGAALAPLAVTIGTTTGATVSATHLDLANAAMGVLTAVGTTPWPADTRFAAPPRPVIAVPDDLPDVIDALRRVGAEIVPGLDGGIVPDGADAAVAGIAEPGPGCSVTVAVGERAASVLARPFADAVALDVAALVTGLLPPQRVWPLTAAEHTELVVFGAHLRGGALEHQLTDLGARWAGEIATSDRYRMTRLPTTPPKPAVTRVPDGAVGTAMKGQRWLLSPAALGRFLVALPAPMQLGKVEFDDGTWRTSFGCDGVAADGGMDISRFGGWEAAIAAGAVT